jgi:hypothetical protein
MRALLFVLVAATLLVPAYANSDGIDIIVGGTEYFPGDDGKVFVELFDAEDQPILGAACRTWIWYPNGTRFVAGAFLNEIERGIYDYDVVLPDTLGVYPVSVECFLNDTTNQAYLSNVTPWFTTTGWTTVADLRDDDNSFFEFNESLQGVGDYLLLADSVVTSEGVKTGTTPLTVSAYWYEDNDNEKLDEQAESNYSYSANFTYPCGNCSNSTSILEIEVKSVLERQTAHAEDPANDTMYYYLYNFTGDVWHEVGAHNYTSGEETFVFILDGDFEPHLNDFFNGSHIMLKTEDTIGSPEDVKATHVHIDEMSVTLTLETDEAAHEASFITKGDFVFDYVNSTETIDISSLSVQTSLIFDYNNGTPDVLNWYIYNFLTSEYDVLGAVTNANGVETQYVFEINGTNYTDFTKYMNGTNILVKYNDTEAHFYGNDTNLSRVAIDSVEVFVSYGAYGIQNTVRGGNEMHVNRPNPTLLSYLVSIWADLLKVLGIVEDNQVYINETRDIANQTLNLVQALGGSVSVVPQDIVAYTGQNLTVMAGLTVGSIPDDTAACTLRVYYPNATLWINSQNMTSIGADGLYETNVLFTEELGNYQAIATCSGGSLSGSVRGLASWTVEEGVRMISIT